MRAIEIRTPGGAAQMRVVDAPIPTPGPREVLVRTSYAGVNFIDTYQRSGVYPASMPLRLGVEGAGAIVDTGAEVEGFAAGDEVAWAFSPGSYAEYVAVPMDDLFSVPQGLAPEIAAAAILQGLTAHFLSTSSYSVAPGDTVLIHAGAGGVGLLLTQMAASRGARVITTVSTAAKAELSRSAGAHHVLRYDQMDSLTTGVPDAVRSLTGGRGAQAVYDGVGKATFDGSLASLAARGTCVLFGGASGQVAPFDLQRLNAGGSLSVTRPKLGDFLATADERAWRSQELFGAIVSGALRVHVGGTFTLEQAAAAHEALESRATSGKLLLAVA